MRYPYANKQEANAACLAHGCTGLVSSTLMDGGDGVGGTEGSVCFQKYEYKQDRCVASWFSDHGTRTSFGSGGAPSILTRSWWFMVEENRAGCMSDGKSSGWMRWWNDNQGAATCYGCPADLHQCSPPPSPPFNPPPPPPPPITDDDGIVCGSGQTANTQTHASLAEAQARCDAIAALSTGNVNTCTVQTTEATYVTIPPVGNDERNGNLVEDCAAAGFTEISSNAECESAYNFLNALSPSDYDEYYSGGWTSQNYKHGYDFSKTRTEF